MYGRILGLKLTDTNKEITYQLLVVYLPTNNKFEEEYMQMVVQKLRLPNTENISNYMILGDFNFIDHEKDKTNGLNSKDKQLNKVWGPFIEEMELVDPFREQNPKRKIWSFVGTGVAKNSRIDRIYVNMVNIHDITNIKYIATPFHGHKILAFRIKNDTEWGEGYYKLNTSLFEDEEYDNIVQETIAEIQSLRNRTNIEKWEIFMMTLKTKSIQYSTKRNSAKRKLKNELIRQMSTIEGSEEEEFAEHYSYLKED